VLVDISEFDDSNDTRVCEWLTKEVKVATLSGSSFFHEKVDNQIRFHFAKKEETLCATGERLPELRIVWNERGYQKR